MNMEKTKGGIARPAPKFLFVFWGQGKSVLIFQIGISNLEVTKCDLKWEDK